MAIKVRHGNIIGGHSDAGVGVGGGLWDRMVVLVVVVCGLGVVDITSTDKPMRVEQIAKVNPTRCTSALIIGGVELVHRRSVRQHHGWRRVVLHWR